MYNKIFIFLFAICTAEAFKVLLVYPMPLRSLNSLGVGISRHLLLAGHEVSIILLLFVRSQLKAFSRKFLYLCFVFEMFIQGQFTVGFFLSGDNQSRLWIKQIKTVLLIL